MKLLSQFILLVAVVMCGSVSGFAQLTPEPVARDVAADFLREGDKLLQRGEWAAAEKHFKRATERRSGNAVWYVCLAVALDKQGRREEAHRELKKIIEIRDIESLLSIHEKMKDGKIVFVDTRSFGDEKAGIHRFVAATKNLEREFFSWSHGFSRLESRIKEISDELLYIKNEKEIKARQEERLKLQKELESMKKDFDDKFDKRFEKVVGPVASDIGKALDAYAKKRGFAFILDNRLFENVTYFSDKSINVTQDFITDYNKLYPVSLPAANQ